MLWFGSALSIAVKSWQTVKAIPWLWRIITNWGEVEAIFKDIWSIFESAKNNRGIPTCDDSKKLISCVRRIFEKDFVDLPNLDEAQFAQMLTEIEQNIVCALKEAQPKRGAKNG